MSTAEFFRLFLQFQGHIYLDQGEWHTSCKFFILHFSQRQWETKLKDNLEFGFKMGKNRMMLLIKGWIWHFAIGIKNCCDIINISLCCRFEWSKTAEEHISWGFQCKIFLGFFWFSYPCLSFVCLFLPSLLPFIYLFILFICSFFLSFLFFLFFLALCGSRNYHYPIMMDIWKKIPPPLLKFQFSSIQGL